MGRGGEVSGVSRSYEAAQKAHRESWKQMEERKQAMSSKLIDEKVI